MTAADPCSKCLSFLAPNQPQQQQQQQQQQEDSSISTVCCPVCLGLWGEDNLQLRLTQAITQASEPYGGFVGSSSSSPNNNRFSADKDPPVVSLPGDIIFRYHTASKLPQFRATSNDTQTFVQGIKNYVNDQLAACIKTLENDQQQQQQSKAAPAESTVSYPDCVTQEEQGFLACHILLATPKSVPRPPYLGKLSNRNTKRSRRKRYETQGGHPRSNLERKLHLDSNVAALWTVNQAMAMAENDNSSSPSSNDWFVQQQPKDDGSDERAKSMAISSIPLCDKDEPFQIHVALWRRPFLVQGNYTKTRRDVSQTPFFIDGDNPKKRQRLGITSIEELILPPLVELCAGISTINNSPDGDNVFFGKAKFHASGREDMDVRMILPATVNAQHSNASNGGSSGNSEFKNITGRPFCCEIIDAKRMPTVTDLQHMLHTINHTGPATSITSDQQSALLPASSQYYGRSSLGVGVDPKTLAFAKGEVFKNLQSETEEKHKFYGCLCWSEQVLPPPEELARRLTTTTTTGRSSSGDDRKSLFPLELQQRTPIRVLHRRANAVRIRHILSCHHLERLDDHYFRLHISTDAGTYVKEYCHGDLGRTQPNVSTLLGCGKTDILELDCEGIQIN